ncbi:single-stranded DNA-binding protein [Streptococcus sp. A18]|uniref:single-stranded DNA-binding protein n=1 Tax=Streptococcus sp. A18 TaxID=3373125 RepID=UPI00374C8C14
MINNVVLVGRMTKDAELRYTPSNVAVATFTLAVNRNRKNENGEREASMFTVRNASDYEKAYINYQYDRQFMKRVNGELTAFNTIEIIKRYDPRYFIIENPASGRLWKYIEEVIGFKLPYLNLTRYNNYDYPLQKPTKFASNLDLGLKNDIIKQEVEWKHFSKSYNERSNIPQNLVIEIFTKVYNKFLQEKQNDR